MENSDKINVGFAAIDKELVTTIPQPTEKEMSGKKFLAWGDDNCYPDYLYNLYLSVSTLKTIIDGTADFVAGNGVRCNVTGFEKEVNKEGLTAFELVRLLARDWNVYGGFAFQVIRNKGGRVAELYYIDFRYLRADKNKNILFYSEEYAKKYARSSKTVVYPKFIPEATGIPASIVYVTNEGSRTYPVPKYCGAIKACEIERHIDEFHLSALENGFGASYIINFLNGIPSDEQKAEIEKNMVEKFAGASNAGRMMLNFANSKDNATTVERLDITDFSEKYKAAADRSREQIFCSFRAVPAIFGLMTESKGFAEEEFQQAFRLYNRTAVRPIQILISDCLDKVFGMSGSLTIDPFSIDENNTETDVR